MSYTYLQEQGEESSVDNFQDIPAYVLSRLNLTQNKSCCNGSETESCHGSQSGMISEHSMEHLGKEELTSFAEDFLAKTFPQLEKELESRANALGFGERWPGWLAKYDQDLSLWKTPQCSLLEDYIEFSETWPKWGMMRDGVCWELTTQVLRTEGRESGYWPTPRSRDWKDGDSVPPSRVNNPGLATLGQQIAMDKQSYPTPGTTGMSNGSGNCEKANKLHETGQISEEERKSMRAENGGQLNPDWVEWLMGWPIGWTKTEPIELDWRNWVVDPADTGEVPRVSQSINNRVHRLKAIGNGQVPLVAALAFTILLERLTYEEFGKEVNNGK